LNVSIKSILLRKWVIFPSSGAESMNKFVELFLCPEPISLSMEAVTSYETTLPHAPSQSIQDTPKQKTACLWPGTVLHSCSILMLGIWLLW
jgi:hypothetical protein